MLGAAVLLSLAAPAPSVTPPAAAAPASRVGLYRIQQMEMAGGLELRADGSFRYALEYGAVSETAEGLWAATPTGLTLTSKPMPKAPSFELVADDPAPAGELWMTLENPGFHWGHPLYALGTAKDAPDGVRMMADETGRVDLEGKQFPSAISPLMPVYGLTGQSFPLSQDRGHRLRFRFHANDLGSAAFDQQVLRDDGRGLTMKRYDSLIRFLPDRP